MSLYDPIEPEHLPWYWYASRLLILGLIVGATALPILSAVKRIELGWPSGWSLLMAAVLAFAGWSIAQAE